MTKQQSPVKPCDVPVSFDKTVQVYNTPQYRKAKQKKDAAISFDTTSLYEPLNKGQEKMYRDGVKIGNWFENRKKEAQINWFTETSDAKTRCVTPPYPSHKVSPTNFSPHSYALRELYTRPNFLFKHHGNRYENKNCWLVTTYQNELSSELVTAKDRVRELRQWDKHNLRYNPEPSSAPFEGKVRTSFMTKTAEKHANDKQEGRKVTQSTVHSAYQCHQVTEKEKSIAIPKNYSSKLEPISRINKNLHLRSRKYGLVPDVFPNIELIEEKLEKIKAIRCSQ